MEDIAAVLGTDIPTAVWELEARGFARTIERITLDDEERSAIYAWLREDRLARADENHVDPLLVRREVIATLRLAGIDARRLLPVEKPC